MKRLTIEEFILKARQVHGWKYDYQKVNYINARTKVCITCHEHGEFWQTPSSHLNGEGCKKCGIKNKNEKRRLSINEFIKQARKIHENKYNYSKVNYINTNTKVCIICHEHGEFWQTPNKHLSQKHGCPKCANSGIKLTTEVFIKKAREKHGDKYDYSNVKYINAHTKVCIICPKHGKFLMEPGYHIFKQGCPKCGKENACKKLKKTKKEFIEKSKKIHNNKYDYSKVIYDGNKTKVCIICPKHGEFWQTPNDHMNGHGCPSCNERKLEKETRLFLTEQNIKFEYQKHFKWLGLQSLDFYLPDYNVGIECQGSQHFEPVEFFGGEKAFEKQVERDNRKKKLCEEHNIKIYYVNNIKDIKKLCIK